MAQPGDVISMSSGTYPTAPIPARSGSSSAPIEYRGNPSNKNLVVVPPISLSGLDYITYRYFRVSGGTGAGLRIDGDALGWKMAGLTVLGDWMLANVSGGSFDSVAVYPPVVSGSLAFNYFVFGGAACPLNGGGAMTNTVVHACSLYVRSVGGHQYCFTADPLAKLWGAMKTNVSFVDNKFLIVMAPGSDAGSKRGLYLGNFQNSTFRGNKWVLVDSANVCALGTGCITARIRDYFLSNTFTNDSFYVKGSGAPFYLSSQGEPNDRTTEGQSKWKNCLFSSTNGGNFDFNWGIRGDTLQNCVFLSDAYRGDPGILRTGSIDGAGLTTVIDHNTFYTTVPPSTNAMGGLAVDMGNWEANAALQITNNIFYRPTGASSSTSSAAYFTAFAGMPYTFNNNLFAYYGGNGKSINYRYNCPSCTPSGGGLSAPGLNGAWYGGTGQDAASRYGSPLFVDSSFTSFNPHLRLGSAAIGMGTSGTDVGALPYAALGPDVTPPAAITSLAISMVSDHNLVLTWTAPGDDGNVGIATAYDLRWSMSPISDANFSSANSISLSAPSVAGSPQATVLTGLVGAATYYYAIKTVDESGNWSALSNLLAVRMATADQVSPSAVPDLSGGP
ncbi:MAG: hypothetical protein E6K80_11695 [Candidatus Eisenbacteria bacterium]|uniref:Fibronectin type-III domain-containing protein n=1 Tax=Eiseniibacteriota bacterium TaxID=2212470 RepID=A0A538U0Q2_UNCEI|nr:MAG: hypothetical protein E6K80_11695 [Candidatus Eisenbacteria bacterium]